MIAREDIGAIANRPPRAERMLTVCLDVDQSNEINLNRGYERSLRNALRDCRKKIDGDELREKFDGDAEAIERFVTNHPVSERGLFILSDSKTEELSVQRLQVPTPNCVSWASVPLIQPLVEAYDEHEPYAVVNCSRDHSDVFVFALGDAQMHSQTHADSDVHKFDATGRGHMWSQARFQRAQDVHAKSHMREVVDALIDADQRTPFERLLLGGPEESVSLLKSVLPDRLNQKKIHVVSLPPNVDAQTVLEATRKQAETWERDDELEIAERLVTAAAKDGPATLGLYNSFDACFEGRIQTLVYADGYTVPEADRDVLLGRLESVRGFPHVPPVGNGNAADDFLNLLINAVLRRGGEIEQLRGDAAELLTDKTEGIGAFLRY